MRSKSGMLFTLGAVGLALSISIAPIMLSGAANSGISIDQSTPVFGDTPGDFRFQAAPIYVQMLDFNPELERASLAYYIWPTDDFAMRQTSSVLSREGFELMIDSHEGQIRRFEAGAQIGAANATSDVLSFYHPELASDAFYPFDRYVLDTYAQVKLLDNDSGEYVPVQTFDYFYSAPIPGFEVKYQRLAAFDLEDSSAKEALVAENIARERSEGKISFFAFIERSGSVKIVALFSYIFMCVVALIVTLIARAVLISRARASINSLIWASASILGMLQLRSMMPGNPRIGITLDYWLYFPSLGLVLFSMTALGYAWIKREQGASS